MDIIVGLGNPGRRYQHTRHNIGFDVVAVLAQRHRISLRSQDAVAYCGTGRIGCRSVLLVQPQTYMNASGQAVSPLVQRYLRPGEQFIVVHDDIDLPLGTMKLKQRGGDAGHLGVRSIMQHLQSGEFVRLRLGVGRPLHKEDVVDYVLSPFTAEEAADRQAIIACAVEWLEQRLSVPDAPSRSDLHV